MDANKIKEIEAKIADLKARWPPHSVPPSMWQQLEELETELEAVKKENSKKPDQN
jgi:hypothetical protein